MSPRTKLFDPVALDARLDLGPVTDHADLIRKLQERRRHCLAGLSAPNPGLGSAMFAEIQMAIRAEIDVCEEALDEMGEPYEEDDA